MESALMNLLENSLIENVLAGIIGAIIVFIYVYIANIIKDYLFKKRLSLEGNYITYFYDTQNGERVKSIATAQIKQFRKSLKGKSCLLKYSKGKERDWKLMAEIVDQQNILGNYICTTPFQNGMGTFSLRIVNENFLSGHWSGYDSDNNVMNHGEYIFRKTLKIKIEKAKKADWSSIIRICDDSLGKDYFSEINSEKHYVYVAKSRSLGVVGFVTIEVIGKDDFFNKYPLMSANQTPKSLNYCDSKGLIRVINTIAIDSKYQGRGIGASLFAYAEEKCFDDSTNAIVVPAWKRGEKINLKSILSNNGYNYFYELPKYWEKECDKKQFSCPARKDYDKCICSLVMYWKLVSKK